MTVAPDESRSNDHSLTRRDAVKILGAGAAMISLWHNDFKSRGRRRARWHPAAFRPAAARLRLRRAGAANRRAHDGDSLHEHHQAYITNANKALADHPELKSMTGEAILANLDGVPSRSAPRFATTSAATSITRFSGRSSLRPRRRAEGWGTSPPRSGRPSARPMPSRRSSPPRR